jgi:hypothetical protein
MFADGYDNRPIPAASDSRFDRLAFPPRDRGEPDVIDGDVVAPPALATWRVI